jgi:hypothetical protein
MVLFCAFFFNLKNLVCHWTAICCLSRLQHGNCSLQQPFQGNQRLNLCVLYAKLIGLLGNAKLESVLGELKNITMGSNPIPQIVPIHFRLRQLLLQQPNHLSLISNVAPSRLDGFLKNLLHFFFHFVPAPSAFLPVVDVLTWQLEEGGGRGDSNSNLSSSLLLKRAPSVEV